MKNCPLTELLKSKHPVILDGAMGTELQRRGVDISLPLWSARAVADNAETVRAIHRDYLEAGADIITTNTFRTTARTFCRAGLPDRSEEYTQRAVALARDARAGIVDRPILIAGSLAPLEDCYRPDVVPPDDHLCDEHGEHARRLAAAGVDFILIETMGTVREARAACEAAVGTGKEVVVSFLCTAAGHLYGGDSLEEAVRMLSPFRPAAFSLNCISPRQIDVSLSQLRTVTELPIAVYANVGHSGEERSDVFQTDIGPEEYRAFVEKWIERGVAIVGGCCGTTPAYIAKLTTMTQRPKG